MEICDAVAIDKENANPEEVPSKAECRKKFDAIKKACAIVRQTGDNLVRL